MFDLLKKRISGFVDKLSGKGEKEGGGAAPEKEAPAKEAPEKKKQEEKAPTQKDEVKKSPGKEKESRGEAKKPKKGKEGKKKPDSGKKGEPAPEKKKPEAAGKAAKKKEERGEAAPVKEAPASKAKEVGGKAEVAREGEKPRGKGAEVPKKAEEPPPEEGKKAGPEKKKGFLEGIFGRGKKEEPGKEEKGAPAEGRKPEAETPEKAGGGKPEAKEEPAKAGKGESPKAEEKVEAGKGEKEFKKEEELKKKVKKSLFASVSETIRGESEVREDEIVELLEELELGMLESDVALSVAEEIKEELKKRIIGSKVKRGQTASFVRESLREILIGMFEETPGFELHERLGEEGRPHKIMVVGPNGAGKTTTIAKLVNLLKKSGHSVCVAASDTFRAAAVEQLVHHGNKLGVTVIHGAYGSDPTSIAFDALNHAKANDIDVVIIDTAGRQDTNVNLINQLKKMDRVIKPELKIYVGESIAGNAMVEQISTFNTDVGLDGVVLTKLDCDPKGGTVISVSRVAKLPILYVGVGQGYGDLKKFNAKEIVGEILS